MKIRFFIFASVLCLLGTGVFVWWLAGSKQATERNTSKGILKTTATLQKPANPTDTNLEKDDAQESKSDEEMLKETSEEGAKSNVPIRFYGKVIDQDGVGVPGAVVKAEVTAFDEGFMSRPESDSQKKIALERETDSQGLFSIEGVKGQMLDVKSLEKAGYQIAKDQQSYGTFAYSLNLKHHNPDRSKPVIYHMWKNKGAEPLIQSKKTFDLGSDGKFYTIDLLKQKRIEGSSAEGDIRVQIKLQEPSEGRKKGLWSLVVDAVDGGITEANDPFLHSAPESGYEPGCEMEIGTSAYKNFYLRSRGGKVYASMRITVFPHDKPISSLIEIDCLANPAGSRNLEFDPEKKINK